MMADLNRVQLFGRLGTTPEIRQSKTGDKVATFRMATSDKWKDRASGEQKERTEWHTVVVWTPLADTVQRFLRKGRRVMVEGNLRTRKWQDQSGTDRYATEVVLSGHDARLTLIDFEDGPAGDRQVTNSTDDDPTTDMAHARDINDEVPF